MESGLFFTNADNIRAAVRDRVMPTTSAVVLDASTTPAIDVSATEMLAQLAGDLRRDGIALLIAHGIGQVCDVLRRAGADQDVLQTMYNTVDEAVAAAPAHREPDK